MQESKSLKKIIPEFNKLVDKIPADKISTEYLCPISGQIMCDPVKLIESGRTYERKNLEKWFKSYNFEPATGEKIKNKTILSNYLLQQEIGKFVKNYGQFPSKDGKEIIQDNQSPQPELQQLPLVNKQNRFNNLGHLPDDIHHGAIIPYLDSNSHLNLGKTSKRLNTIMLNEDYYVRCYVRCLLAKYNLDETLKRSVESSKSLVSLKHVEKNIHLWKASNYYRYNRSNGKSLIEAWQIAAMLGDHKWFSHNNLIDNELASNILNVALEHEYLMLAKLIFNAFPEDKFSEVCFAHFRRYFQRDWYEATASSIEVVKFLLSCSKVDVNTSNTLNSFVYKAEDDEDDIVLVLRTPLHVAAIKKDKKMVELLLSTPEIKVDITDTLLQGGMLNVEHIYGGKTAVDLSTDLEITQKIKQYIKAQECIQQAGCINTDKINIKLAKIFDSYAHPPLFSINWRNSGLQKIADKISKRLYAENNAGFDECLGYIHDEIGKIDQSEIKSFGTFKGILLEIEKLRSVPVVLEQNNEVGNIKIG